ncbi:nickel/cobalt ABC transporter permease [Basfia succiniciproducens]|uniref:nickel/cobalt ABC transporter permease n=1 Tax=Basfia succiniciproducens TaxID=653940 RepID=UPI003FCE05DE
MSGFIKQLRSDIFAQCCLFILTMIGLAGIFAPWICTFDPATIDMQAKLLPVSAQHWLGTDHLGRDIFSRLIGGVRSTVFYGLFAMLLTMILGILMGMTAAIGGKKTDEFIMRLCDVLLSFPGEIMILALVGMLGPGIEHILVAVILVKWAWYARMIRGTVMQYTHKNYVHYSQAIGVSPWRIIRRHLLPVATAELIILASADMGAVILLISGLSFLGLGVQPPTPEWGAMLSDAKNIMLLYPQQMLPAGLAITLTVTAFNGFGDFLRDVLDPDSPLKGTNNE